MSPIAIPAATAEPDVAPAVLMLEATPIGRAAAATATAPMPFNAAASGASNQGPLNPALEEAVKGRIDALQASDPTQMAAIPVDLVTASGSGLDPHISVAAARWQAPRIARVRHLPEEQVRALIAQHTEGRQLGVLGEPRVNVLELNLALDKLASTR